MLLEEHSGQTELFTPSGELQRVTYLTRIDPFSGNVAKISEERARRAIGLSAELQIRPVENCVFCDFEKYTPRERIFHACGAVSVPNKYPWEKYDWITIYPPFTYHKLFLSDLYFEDLERMMESAYELATICARDPAAISFMDFTNWGVFAGASQQHPHSQRKSITEVPSPTVSNEMKHCQRLIANIIQTTEYDRRRIIQPVLGIFPALFFCRGITNLNIAVHMAPFAEMEQARKYYRWHMHIYPRRGRLPVDQAGAEIGFGTGVIDTLPEVTAELLRCWYRNGPDMELVAKDSNGCPAPGLLEEFHKFVSNCR